MFKTSCDIYLSLMREGHVLIPRTVRALQTLALSGGCALSVRTLWAHMLRQDNKLKIESIMKHKTFNQS